MTGTYPHLFAPISLGRREAKNRIMRVATTANLADRNRVGERLLEFYRTLAKGGVGTIVTEALRISAQEAYGPGALVVHDRPAVEGLRRLADVCHAEGALLIGQLNHGGRQHLASRVIPHMVAPSAVACPRSGGVPHALSTREVRELVEMYIMCAVHCIEAGMDGVEIHGAQGHLIQQFVSPFSNRRTDDYGGSEAKRLRFPREIIDGVRQRIGRRAIVGYRLGVEEFTEGGLGIEQTLEIARSLTADGQLDYLSLSQGNFNSIETHLPDRHWPILAFQDIQSRFKSKLPDVTIIASTRIQGPEQAERVLAAGEADMIGMCRALLVDPDWPNKARRGHAEDIRRCIACNQCWGWISGGEPIACATNPTAGREYQFKKLVRAESPRHVVVVGGGPAGLEAGRVAALRGHRVTLLEAEAELGGRLKRVHSVPHYEEMRHLFDFLVPQARKAGVAIKTGVRGTVESILDEQPDEIIIATGATPIGPGHSGRRLGSRADGGRKRGPHRPRGPQRDPDGRGRLLLGRGHGGEPGGVGQAADGDDPFLRGVSRDPHGVAHRHAARAGQARRGAEAQHACGPDLERRGHPGPLPHATRRGGGGCRRYRVGGLGPRQRIAGGRAAGCRRGEDQDPYRRRCVLATTTAPGPGRSARRRPARSAHPP